MKLSTIYKRAAQRVADYQADCIFRYCCTSIDWASDYKNKGEAHRLFSRLFKPKGALSAWWPNHSDGRDHWFTEVQDARVIALLLAAEIAKEEGL